MDTNVALKNYLPEDLAEEAEQVLKAGVGGTAELVAPTLLLLEFRHSLTRRERRGELSSEEVGDMWERFGAYPLHYREIGPLIPRAAGMSVRTGCTVYDAVFVALAESEEVVVITADGKLTERLENTPFANHVQHLEKVGELLGGR